MQSQSFNSFAFGHSNIDNSSSLAENSPANCESSSVISSYGRQSVMTNQTKTTAFFSFFAEDRSKTNSSDCSQMLRQLGEELDSDSNNKMQSYQANAQSHSTFEHSMRPLNKTQMFMQAFKETVNQSKETVRNFKKDKGPKYQTEDGNSSGEELTNLIQQTRKETHSKELNQVELKHVQPKLVDIQKMEIKQKQGQNIKNTQSIRLATDKNNSLQISHISDNLESSLSDFSLWQQDKQHGAISDIKHKQNNSITEIEQNKEGTIIHRHRQNGNRNQSVVLKQDQIQAHRKQQQEEEQDDDSDVEDQESEQLQEVDRDKEQEKICTKAIAKQTHKQELKQINKVDNKDEEEDDEWQSEQKSQSSVMDEDEYEERQIAPALRANQPAPLQIQVKKSIIIGIYCYKKMIGQINQIKQSIVKYYPSNYFHVGPRQQILNFLRQLLTETVLISGMSTQQTDVKYCNYVGEVRITQKIDIVTYNQIYQQCLRNIGIAVRRHFSDKDKQNQLLEICAQYKGSNYFHVGKRRFMLGQMEFVLKLVENMTKTVSAKKGPNLQNIIPNKPNVPELIIERQSLPQRIPESRPKVSSNLAAELSNISQYSTEQSFSQFTRSLQSCKSEAVGKYLSQHLNKALVSSLEKTVMQYHSSNYFHVGPRYEMLDFMGGLVDFVKSINSNSSVAFSQTQKENSTFVKAGQQIRKYLSPSKMESVMSTCHSYHSSNYFHVGPRYSIMGDIRFVVEVYKKMQIN